MSKKSKQPFKASRLQFTEEERADPTLEKLIVKSEKAADKVDKAQAKILQKTIKTKERTLDANIGKTKVRYPPAEELLFSQEKSHAFQFASQDM